MALPSTTNNGTSAPLVACAFVDNGEGQPVLDQNGNRPPLNIKIVPVNADSTVAQPTGQTDPQGCFRTTATLSKNLAAATYRIEARYPQPSPSPGSAGRSQPSARAASDEPDALAYIGMVDPCTTGDAAEPTCQPNANTDPNLKIALQSLRAIPASVQALITEI